VPAHEDEATLTAQMGRPLQGRSRVVDRCRLGLPVVIETHPVLEDGRPFPTLYYLVCPLARARVSRVEAAGGVRDLTARLEREPELAAAFARAQADYARQRARRLPAAHPVQARLQGGVGGARGGVKCLHAHFAHLRAGSENPVGAAIRDRVEPLDCAVPCVRDGRRSPAWREPTG